MTFSVEVDLGGIKFTATEDTVEALLAQYEQMKGDSGWLLKKVQETVPLAEAGKASTFVSYNPDLDAAESAQDPQDAWAQDGPWNAAGSTQSAQKVDPWDNTPVSDNKPSQTRSAPQRPAQQPSQGASRDVDKYGRVWTRGLPDAPLCNCGLPTVRMDAKSGPTSKKPGTPYSKFRCDNPNNGCGYDEFPPK